MNMILAVNYTLILDITYHCTMLIVFITVLTLDSNK